MSQHFKKGVHSSSAGICSRNRDAYGSRDLWKFSPGFDSETPSGFRDAYDKERHTKRVCAGVEHSFTVSISNSRWCLRLVETECTGLSRGGTYGECSGEPSCRPVCESRWKEKIVPFVGLETYRSDAFDREKEAARSMVFPKDPKGHSMCVLKHSVGLAKSESVSTTPEPTWE